MVDDVADVRLLLQMALGVEGYDVVTANDGQHALEMIESAQPDLVLLDVMMPVLDGWGVLDALDQATAPPVIVFSGFANHDRSPLAMALEKGAVDFLSKPFDMEQLSKVIERVLTKTKDQLEAERLSRLQTL